MARKGDLNSVWQHICARGDEPDKVVAKKGTVLKAKRGHSSLIGKADKTTIRHGGQTRIYVVAAFEPLGHGEAVAGRNHRTC